MLGEAKDAGLGNGQDTQSRAWTGMADVGWEMPLRASTSTTTHRR